MHYINTILFSAIFMFVYGACFGQIPQTEEEMFVLLQKTRIDTLKVRIMSNFAWSVRSSLPDKSFVYAQKAHKFAREINDIKGIIKTLSFMGIAMRNLGNYGIASNYLEEALELAQKHSRQEEVGFGYINFGNILYLEGKYQEALIYINRAIPIARHLNQTQMKAYIHINLGRIHHKLKRNEEALHDFGEALTLRKKLRDSIGIITVQFEMSESYISQNNFTEAKKVLTNIITSSRKYNDFGVLAGANDALARVALIQSQPTQARTFAENGLKYALQIKDKYRIVAIYATLASIETAEKRYEQALKYQTSYIIYQDSLHQETLHTRADRWEFSYELQRKEAEIQREMLEIHRRDFWMALLAGALLLAITVGIFIYTRYKEHQKTNKEFKIINGNLKESQNEAESYTQEAMQLNEVLHKSVEALRVSEDQQKRLNQILTDKNNTLQEMNHEKDSLMGIVAHDLKAPLNRIRGILELLNLSGELNPDQHQLMHMGHDILNNGSNLIRDLLDITYYEQGGTKMHLEKFDWVNFMNEHLTSYIQEAQKKNILLHYTPPAEPIDSISDEDCLSRIISNLLSNAIKFSPKNKGIYVTLEAIDSQIIIQIKDEGPGFTEDDKRKLFNKFEKLSAKPTAGEASSGLGLSIIKVLTEKLKGTVSLESEAGKGATFILTFPITV